MLWPWALRLGASGGPAAFAVGFALCIKAKSSVSFICDHWTTIRAGGRFHRPRECLYESMKEFLAREVRDLKNQAQPCTSPLHLLHDFSQLISHEISAPRMQGVLPVT